MLFPSPFSSSLFAADVVYSGLPHALLPYLYRVRPYFVYPNRRQPRRTKWVVAALYTAMHSLWTADSSHSGGRQYVTVNNCGAAGIFLVFEHFIVIVRLALVLNTCVLQSLVPRVQVDGKKMVQSLVLSVTGMHAPSSPHPPHNHI